MATVRLKRLVVHTAELAAVMTCVVIPRGWDRPWEVRGIDSLYGTFTAFTEFTANYGRFTVAFTAFTAFTAGRGVRKLMGGIVGVVVSRAWCWLVS